MTFDELVAEVYTLTNRPDLVAETKLAIKSATLKAHQTDFYSKDIYETGVEFTNPAYIQSLDLPSLISNFRAISYLRRMEDTTDADTTLGENVIEIITPLEVLDSYGVTRTNVAYVAGRMLEIRSSVEFYTMMLGCYVLPIVRDGAYSSWIAELYPYTIVREAARTVFKTIGQDEQAAAYERLVAEEYLLLKMSALTDVGY